MFSPTSLVAATELSVNSRKAVLVCPSVPEKPGRFKAPWALKEGPIGKQIFDALASGLISKDPKT